MTEETWTPKPLPKDYATTEEVAEVAGVERGALYEWLREGLLPKPQTTGGRGIIAKWPLSTLTIAKFVRSQRDLAYGLSEIRPRIVAAFGEKILEVLAEPRGPRARKRKTLAKASTAKKAGKKATGKKVAGKTAAKKTGKKAAKKKAAKRG
jgi:predicted DNA-binding transcriptional regulator AlpA